MTKKYRRNHNLKYISSSRSYTVKEVAEKIDVQTKTVYAWIKQGLMIIEGSSPERLHGSDMILPHINGQFVKNNLIQFLKHERSLKVVG